MRCAVMNELCFLLQKWMKSIWKMHNIPHSFMINLYPIHYFMYTLCKLSSLFPDCDGYNLLVIYMYQQDLATRRTWALLISELEY